jgi:hypothetical protein
MHWLTVAAWLVGVPIAMIIVAITLIVVVGWTGDLVRQWRKRKSRVPYRPSSRFDKPGDKL